MLFYDSPQRFDDAQRADLQRRASALAVRLRRVQAAGPPRAGARATSRSSPGSRSATSTSDAHPSAVGETRRHLRRTLQAWGVDDDLVDTAVLCLSEVVTNAIVHTGAGAELRATLDQGVLTVTVRDRGRTPAAGPSTGRRAAGDPAGRRRTPCACTGGGSRCSTPSPTAGGPSSTRSAPPCGSCSRPEPDPARATLPGDNPWPSSSSRCDDRGMRALFATTGGIGHLGPLVPLARACLDAGHEVVVAAPEVLRRPGDQGRARSRAVRRTLPPTTWAGCSPACRSCHAPRRRTSWCARSSAGWTPGRRCPACGPWSRTGGPTSSCVSRPSSPRSSPPRRPGCRTPRWRSA